MQFTHVCGSADIDPATLVVTHRPPPGLPGGAPWTCQGTLPLVTSCDAGCPEYCVAIYYAPAGRGGQLLITLDTARAILEARREVVSGLERLLVDEAAANIAAYQAALVKADGSIWDRHREARERAADAVESRLDAIERLEKTIQSCVEELSSEVSRAEIDAIRADPAIAALATRRAWLEAAFDLHEAEGRDAAPTGAGMALAL